MTLPRVAVPRAKFMPATVTMLPGAIEVVELPPDPIETEVMADGPCAYAAKAVQAGH